MSKALQPKGHCCRSNTVDELPGRPSAKIGLGRSDFLENVAKMPSKFPL